MTKDQGPFKIQSRRILLLRFHLAQLFHVVLPNSSSYINVATELRLSNEITVKRGKKEKREERKKIPAFLSRSIKLPNSHQEQSIPRNYRERDFLGSLSVARSKSWSINQRITEVTAPNRPRGHRARRFAIKSVNFSHARAISEFVISIFHFRRGYRSRLLRIALKEALSTSWNKQEILTWLNSCTGCHENCTTSCLSNFLLQVDWGFLCVYDQFKGVTID